MSLYQPNADCSDTIGSYDCSCSDGFTETPDVVCIDIDECADGNVCDISATCSNISGSYYCSCNSGFVGNGVYCDDIDESSSEDSCGQNEQCFNTQGSFSYEYIPGFAGDAFESGCVDINECDLDEASNENSVCENTGSYVTASTVARKLATAVSTSMKASLQFVTNKQLVQTLWVY